MKSLNNRIQRLTKNRKTKKSENGDDTGSSTSYISSGILIPASEKCWKPDLGGFERTSSVERVIYDFDHKIFREMISRIPRYILHERNAHRLRYIIRYFRMNDMVDDNKDTDMTDNPVKKYIDVFMSGKKVGRNLHNFIVTFYHVEILSSAITRIIHLYFRYYEDELNLVKFHGYLSSIGALRDGKLHVFDTMQIVCRHFTPLYKILFDYVLENYATQGESTSKYRRMIMYEYVSCGEIGVEYPYDHDGKPPLKKKSVLINTDEYIRGLMTPGHSLNYVTIGSYVFIVDPTGPYGTLIHHYNEYYNSTYINADKGDRFVSLSAVDSEAFFV